MRLFLHGGFAEKGRTSIGVESDGYRLLLDAGVKTGAKGSDYYPAITADALSATDAIVITHAHEDHLAALGWCIAGGFKGRIFMTLEARRAMESCLASYGDDGHQVLARKANVECLPVADALRLGPFEIATGRSGHIVGGVWCLLDDGRRRFLYCGDVVPASPILVMDPPPQCDAIAIDASYADDAVPASERCRQIANWTAARVAGCVLPTPLYGRSLDLLSIVPGPISLASGMKEALHAQIEDTRWLADGAARKLGARLDDADIWLDGEALPHAALICHDAFGMAGPSRKILALARASAHPTLFTGHVPVDSAGERMVRDGLGSRIRLPTHPTRDENLALVAGSGANVVLGHSCDRAGLSRLGQHMPTLRTDLKTGDSIDL